MQTVEEKFDELAAAVLWAGAGSVLGCCIGIGFALVTKDAGITPPIFGFFGGTLIGAVIGWKMDIFGSAGRIPRRAGGPDAHLG